MSRYEYDYTSTLNRAGFYLPVSGMPVFPDEETFARMSGEYDYIPLYAHIKIKDFNIVGLFKSINPTPPACLLESLSGNDNGRYSIMASESAHVISSSLNDPQGMIPIREFLAGTRVPLLDFPFYSGGLIGYWSYEEALRFQDLKSNKNGFTEQYFFMPSEIMVYDRHLGVLTVIVWTPAGMAGENGFQRVCARLDALLTQACNCRIESEEGKSLRNPLNLDHEFKVNIEKDEFCNRVAQAKEHIRQGDIFQVVLSRRWQKQSTADPWDVYLNLRTINPSPYMFYFHLPEFVLMGASPEMQVKVEKGRIKSRPIAGTRKVTGDVDIDAILAEELLADEKEKAEHLMLVDLSRNDVGRVSSSGSVKVSDFMILEKYSHVVHIVSTVEGEVKSEVDALEAFQACFPAGTLSGAPKRKAMEIIDELEDDPRGPYGGAAGFIDFNSYLDSCITIRSILYKNGSYYLQSGAGIVADSIPEMEHEETLHKARVLMLAIKEAEDAR